MVLSNLKLGFGMFVLKDKSDILMCDFILPT